MYGIKSTALGETCCLFKDIIFYWSQASQQELPLQTNGDVPRDVIGDKVNIGWGNVLLPPDAILTQNNKTMWRH